MVRIRIFKAQAVARARSLRSLTSGGLGGAVVAAAIVGASLFGLGETEDGHTSSAASVAPSASAPAGETFTAADASAGAAPGTKPAPSSSVDAAPDLRRTDATPGVPRGYPSNLFQLPPSVTNALVFDLRDNRMHVYEAGKGGPAPIGDYFVAVGKNGIDKTREGDEKTPVGIYFVSSYIPGGRLPAIYGVGAFPISYPNAWDRRLGRTGSGIWIHGTDKDEASLLPQSSRGCLTLRNTDFMTLSQFVRIRRTPVIVSDAVSWTSPAELEADRASLAAAVETWRSDWESLDNDAYFRHYSEDFRTDSMDRAAWTAYKRRVNSAKSYIRVGVDDVGIYAYPGESDLFLVTFEQRYQSNNFRANKWKHQYWQRDAGAWRIVHESGPSS